MNAEIPAPENDTNDNDKLMAALSYPIPIIISIVIYEFCGMMYCFFLNVINIRYGQGVV